MLDNVGHGSAGGDAMALDARGKRLVAGGRPMEVTRVRITGAGRRTLAEQAREP